MPTLYPVIVFHLSTFLSVRPSITLNYEGVEGDNWREVPAPPHNWSRKRQTTLRSACRLERCAEYIFCGEPRLERSAMQIMKMCPTERQERHAGGAVARRYAESR